MVITGPFGDASFEAGVPPAADATADETDGRRLRRDRNRDAVVEALLTLYGEGNLDPSSAEIAERAGLSPRSLFRYFDDIDDLCRAAVVAQIQRVKHLFTVAAEATDPLSVRLAALAEQRVALYDAIEPAATVSRLRAPFHPVLADELRITRAALRKQLRDVLATELDLMEPSRREAMLAAADVLCSFEAHQLMKHSQRLTQPDIEATLSAALSELFGSGDARPGGERPDSQHRATLDPAEAHP